MYALYGSVPQFGAPGSIFFSCGNTSYYKLLSKSLLDTPTWPESIQTHTHEVLGVAVTAVSNTEILNGRLGHLSNHIPPELRTSILESDDLARIHLVASISRDEFRLSVVIPSELDDGKLAFVHEIAYHKLVGDNERYMTLLNSRDKLVLLAARRISPVEAATTALIQMDLFAIQSSSDLNDFISQRTLIDLGGDCVPVAYHMRKGILSMIVSSGNHKELSASPTSSKQKMRKNRQQSVLYIDFQQESQIRAAIIHPDTFSQMQRDSTAITVEGSNLCLAEQGGALHWWCLPPLDATFDVDAGVKLDDLSLIFTDNRIRVHWHNATLSTVQLARGLTYAGGEQSRLVCWNLESGSQRVSDLIIGDGCIINIQVSEDDFENRVIVTTSTNKIYVVDTSITDATTFIPQVVGPVLPVIYPGKVVELKVLSHLNKETSLTNFLVANCGRVETFRGFRAGHIQVSILAFHQSPARVCAHDSDFRVNEIFDEPQDKSSDPLTHANGSPFSLMTFRSHKKHSWSRPESLKSGTAHSLYTGAHAITAATALPELDLIVTAASIGSGINRVHLLELYKINKSQMYPPYRMTCLSQTALAKAPVALEAAVKNRGIIIAFEDGILHFLRLDDDDTKPTFHVVQRETIGKNLTYRDWRSGMREQVLANFIDF